MDERRVNYLKLITLTCASDDWDEFRGAVKRFTAAMRQRWPGARYFWWVEEQERGAPHVHMYWVNAPQKRNVDLNAWCAEAWGAGHTNTRLIRRRQWIDRAAGYLKSYAKKQGAKAYQQEYENTPAYMHLYGSSLKGVPNELLDLHISRWVARYDNGAIVLSARDEHLPGPTCAPTEDEWYTYRVRRRVRQLRALYRDPRRRIDRHIKEMRRGHQPRELEQLQELELVGGYVEWRQSIEGLPW
jgi:hypothetical protein